MLQWRGKREVDTFFIKKSSFRKPYLTWRDFLFALRKGGVSQTESQFATNCSLAGRSLLIIIDAFLDFIITNFLAEWKDADKRVAGVDEKWNVLPVQRHQRKNDCQQYQHRGEEIRENEANVALKHKIMNDCASNGFKELTLDVPNIRKTDAIKLRL